MPGFMQLQYLFKNGDIAILHGSEIVIYKSTETSPCYLGDIEGAPEHYFSELLANNIIKETA